MRTGWIAGSNPLALNARISVLDANRRAGTYLDGIYKCEIDLHGSSLHCDRGLRRCDHYIGQVHGTINEDGISQERIGRAIDAYEDSPSEGLKQTKMRVSGPNEHTMKSDLRGIVIRRRPQLTKYRPIRDVIPS